MWPVTARAWPPGLTIVSTTSATGSWRRPSRAAGPWRPWTWAALMYRVFALDVLAYPRCGRRLRIIAIVQDPVGRPILTHVSRALSIEAPGPAPPALP